MRFYIQTDYYNVMILCTYKLTEYFFYLICKTENVRMLCFDTITIDDFVLDLEITCMFDLGRGAT